MPSPSVKFSSCGLDISVISSDFLKKLALHECRQYRPLHISCPALVSLSIANFRQEESISLQKLTSLLNAFLAIDNADLPLPTLNLLSGLSNARSLNLCIPCLKLKVCCFLNFNKPKLRFLFIVCTC
jgi:hypothetical protein